MKIILVLLAHLAAAGAAAQPLVDFRLDDQHGVARARADLEGTVAILIGSGRAGRAYNRPWGEALAAALATEDARGEVVFLRVADLRAVPPFVRSRVRKRMAGEEERPVLLDWAGRIATAHGFEPGASNVLIVGPHGRIVRQEAVRELDEALVAALAAAARGALSAPASPESACPWSQIVSNLLYSAPTACLDVESSMTQPVTESLLERVAGGDPAAVDACLDQYGDLVWSLARRHCPNPAEAEDAVQEIFIDVWKSAARFDSSRGSEVTFIATIARRRLIDRGRYRQRQPFMESLETPEGTTRELPGARAEQMEASADAALAVKAMEQLDPREREVILLSVYQGMSHSQIASHTEMPLGTVKTYIRRGLGRVSALLQANQGVAT